jgi:DNA polymerase III sliding clamp (beta) subunit (PCNA family)
MDFRIEMKELQRIIRLLGVSAKANTNDYTGQILVEANQDGTVFFASNNNSTGVTITTESAEVSEPGSIITLYSKVKSVAGAFVPWDGEHGTKEVRITANDESATIFVETVNENGKKSKGRVKLDIFKDMRLQRPKPFGEPHFILNSNMFKKAVSKVIYAMDPGEHLVSIQGMNISFGEDDIYFCGTNGRILSEYAVKNNNDLAGKDYVLRYDFVMGLRRAVGEETQVFFEIDGRDIRAKFDDVVFSGRLVIGQGYPKYKPVLETFEKTISVNKEVFMGIISPFTELLNSEDNNRLTFEVGKGRIKLSKDAEGEFEAEADINVDENFVIDINGKFLYQTVEAINDDSLLIKFTDEKGMLIFDSENFQDQKALITPIRRR